VQRIFFLLKDLTINPVLGIVSAPLPKKMNTKKSNIVVGFFDTLLHQKHFDVNDAARQLAARGNIKTIYGEKNLNFSRVAVPVDTFSGDPRVGGTKKTFNPEKDLTLNSASIAIYRESLIDEDASKASCEIEVTENGETIDIISFKNMTRPIVQRNEPGPVNITAAVNIQLFLKSEYKGFPGITYWEESTDPESNETSYGLGPIKGGNEIKDLTNNKLSPLIQVKYYSVAGVTPVLKSFKIKIEYSLSGTYNPSGI